MGYIPSALYYRTFGYIQYSLRAHGLTYTYSNALVNSIILQSYVTVYGKRDHVPQNQFLVMGFNGTSERKVSNLNKGNIGMANMHKKHRTQGKDGAFKRGDAIIYIYSTWQLRRILSQSSLSKVPRTSQGHKHSTKWYMSMMSSYRDLLSR